MSQPIPSTKTRVLGTSVTALLLVVPNLGAQQGGTVTGRVIDGLNSQPIAAVQVSIGSLGIGGLTQQNGRYLLLNVPAGTHQLTVTRVGYRATTATITIRGDRTVEQNFSIAGGVLTPPPRPRPPTWPYWFVPRQRFAQALKD